VAKKTKKKTKAKAKTKRVKAARRPIAKKSAATKKKKKTKKPAAKAVRKVKKAPARKPSPKDALIERELEEGLMETFPASDPVALTDPTTTIKD